MLCKVCNTEQEQIDFSKFLSVVTLACKHSFSLSDDDKKKESERIIFKDGREPFKYQYEGIKFCENAGLRALIADDMGVGKTIQAIGLLARNAEAMTPALFLVKSSLKMQFFKEIFNCLGPKFTPNVIESKDSLLVPGIFKIHIATYDIIRKFSTVTTKKVKSQWGVESDVEVRENPFYTFGFKSVILDECQAIKNPNSTRTVEVMNICKGVPHIIATSGTPIKNRADEYGPILTIIKPDVFPSIEHFNRRWVTTDWETGKWGALSDPARFEQVTKNFVIRRTRQQVMPDLPKINRVFHHVDFDNVKMKKKYQELEDDIVNELEKQHSKKAPSESIIGRITQARHMVGIMKINPILEYLQDFLDSTDRKTVVFLHHKAVMDAVSLKYNIFAVENGLDEALVFHSGLNSNERYDLVQKFRNDKNRRLMIASTLAAGEGVDGLQHVCSDIIIGERQWNPANEEQVEARIERFGQTASQLNSTYVVLSNTIDEFFTQIVETKRAQMKRILDGQEVDWKESALMQELFTVMSNKKRKHITRGF